MLQCKKKHDTDTEEEPEDEDIEIDFDRIYLIARTKMAIPQKEAEYMTYGKWIDIYYVYKGMYNFETKGLLYSDIEKEIKQYQQEHQPVTSLLSL